uniref:7 kDa protein n=1 Tax=Autographa californica nuclear polyhedrosis virus TaxID=46015 RepID=Q64801_NPVAC|nr:7 kDa protein [Autographa californica nucleopolyhedrovirus]
MDKESIVRRQQNVGKFALDARRVQLAAKLRRVQRGVQPVDVQQYDNEKLITLARLQTCTLG